MQNEEAFWITRQHRGKSPFCQCAIALHFEFCILGFAFCILEWMVDPVTTDPKGKASKEAMSNEQISN